MVAVPVLVREDADSSSSVCLSGMSLSSVSVDMDFDLHDDDFACSEAGSVDPESSDDSMARFNEAAPGPAYVVSKGLADFTVKVPYGTLRLYMASNTIVATCDRHGPRCRCNRKYTPAVKAGNPGQGRPIGLLCSWLQLSHAPLVDTKRKHTECALPAFPQRVEARASVQDVIGMAPFFLAERKPRIDEGDEPLAIK